VEFYFLDEISKKNKSSGPPPYGPFSVDIKKSFDSTSINFNMEKAGRMWLHIKLDGIDIQGSPFLTVVHPSKAHAASTICNGAGLRQGSTNYEFPFKVTLKDQYGNELRVGGNKLYARLLGDSNFGGIRNVIPTCIDKGTGFYSCSHKAIYNGSHHLDIKLLNYDMDHIGGLGLTGKYYAVADMHGGDSPIVERIDSILSFRWPNGYIIPQSKTISENELKGQIRRSGQSIRWDGYLLAPKTDSYTFSSNVKNINVTIIVDGIMVHDSFSKSYQTMHLVANAAYSIYIEATSAEYTGNLVTEMEIMWSTPTMRTSLVPTYFLYDSAEDIAFSPFSIAV